MSAGASTVATSRSKLSGRDVRLLLAGLLSATVALWFSSRALLSTDFLPHWYCFVGNARLLWTNVIADALIGVSYVVISLTLAWLVRRAKGDLPYSGFFWAFGLFIVSCGVTHFFEIVTIWKPVYWLSAFAKAVTAIASVGTAAVLLMAADQIVAFVRTARESSARRGNERFRALIQAAPMAVIAVDREGQVTSWNLAAERMFGWELPEVIGGSLPVIPPSRREEHENLLRQTFAGQTINGHETLRANRKGELVPVSLSVAPVRDDEQQLCGAIAVLEDITERKRIELELQEKTEVLSAVTHALNTLLDTGDWNAASQHLLAFAVEQTGSEFGFLGVVLEQNVLRVLAPDSIVWDVYLKDVQQEQSSPEEMQSHESGALNDLLAEVVTRRGAVMANSVTSDANGESLPGGLPAIHTFLGAPIFKGKAAVGLIGIVNRPGGYTGGELTSLEMMSQATGVLYDNYRQDLNRRALEGQQEKLEAQVRQSQKMEVLGRLAGGVAHDFNNMLMVMGGCSELLDRSLPKESPARIYLDQIQRTTEKASAITKQLLAFSRKQVVEFRPTDLHESLTDSEFMLPRLLGSDIELTFRHEAKRSWILSDPAQIEQVVANLAINARDAMPSGGRLTISTRNSANPPEDAVDRANLPEAWMMLEVTDTGTGMDEKTRAQIFEPFFTTKPGSKGTGLGLATVYGIVKQSRGHIRVESVPGRGTTFTLYFPVIDAPPPAPAAVKSPEICEESGSGVTVLIADDEAALRQAVVQILRTTGYRVLEAQTSLEALEMAQGHSGAIDVLLTDIVMPGLRGTELARRVAKAHPEVQVMYMSGYAEGFQESPLPENSIFLQKPFRFATLLEQLKLVRRRS